MTDKSAAGGRKAGSLDRVRRYLQERGHADDLLVFDDRSTRTCDLAAQAVGCEVGQIVK